MITDLKELVDSICDNFSQVEVLDANKNEYNKSCHEYYAFNYLNDLYGISKHEEVYHFGIVTTYSLVELAERINIPNSFIKYGDSISCKTKAGKTELDINHELPRLVVDTITPAEANALLEKLFNLFSKPTAQPPSSLHTRAIQILAANGFSLADINEVLK